jgi:hypothetical protein
MSETKTNDKEIADKIWVDIPSRSGIWKAVEPGDQIEGIYLKKTNAPYRGRPNWKYCFESDDPLAVDGKISFFGTESLNGALEDVLIGKMVRIIYKGERPSSDKMKKPFKVFQIQAFLAPSDPLYKKYSDVETEDGESTPSPSNEPKIPGKAELADADDSDAQNTIENYEDIFKSDNFNKKATPQDIINLAETDPDLDEVDLSRVKAQLARNIKKVAAV